jgi:hypothetical protein
MSFPYDFSYELNEFKEIQDIINSSSFVKRLKPPKTPEWKLMFLDGLYGILSRMYGYGL